ncbi:hypothetical protein H5410_057014 [Solanum commersonii]|uniref:Putative plant transposon protein domain-containing protein n=1 Tax=Solanum commersonii TaxID=4109 RepID=A0A9J5WPD8_SOLCO|nr:hypothetical protein H5410_057014 [Solanum commersonii]
MAPKAKNVAGSKRNRKGETFESSSTRESVQKFGKKIVHVRGKDVKFSTQILNELLGTPNCDPDEFNNLKDKPPYRDIRHTLCGVDSTARWERSKDTGRHNTLYFANFNQVARVWLKIVCSVLLPAKYLTEMTRDGVVLVYMLMKEMPINVGAFQRQNMMKFRNNLRWRFCYGGLITHFLRAKGIEEETVDMTVAYHPDLTGKLVNVTRTKALDTSHGHVLSPQERHARDDSVMTRMFGMMELQLRLDGHLVTDAEMETMAERYPLTKSAAFLCRTGPAFLEPLDDDEATADEAMDDEEDDIVDEEANALMVFDHDSLLFLLLWVINVLHPWNGRVISARQGFVSVAFDPFVIWRLQVYH